MYDYIIEKPPLEEALMHYGVKGMKWRKRNKSRKKSQYNTFKNKNNEVITVKDAFTGKVRIVNPNTSNSVDPEMKKSIENARKDYKKRKKVR